MYGNTKVKVVINKRKRNQKKKVEDLEKQYQKSDINTIFDEKNNNVVMNLKKEKTVKPVTNVKTVKPVTKKLENRVIWKKSGEKQEEDKKYMLYRNKLESIIKRCHDILYSNGSIVGVKAMNDIMRLLTLKILGIEFQKEDSELWNKCNQIKAENNMSVKKFKKLKGYCKDITQLYKHDKNFKNEWKMLVKMLLSKISNIYSTEDELFNCDSDEALTQIIDVIDELDINEDFINSYGTSCGDIHEMFTTYGGKSSSKALGAFFTPRKLIDLILGPLDINKLLTENADIYDPCMGTGGFLTRAYKQVEEPIILHGCETSLDTIKFGYCSVLLTTGKISKNLEKCDSLCQSKTLIDKKYDGILTNPPFGTKQKYKGDKKVSRGLMEKFNEQFPDSKIKFKDIYPIQCNNGACLFIQNCVYKLKEGAFCAIVLPDGELFEGQSKLSKKFRKWWCENVNITKILKVPGGTFEHAGVKTNVVVFQKNGPTQNIEFLQTTKECDSLTYLTTISKTDLEGNNYSLDLTEYLEEEEDEFEVPMVKLADILIKKQKTIFIENNNDYKLIKMSKTNEPTIREFKKGDKIKQKKMQGIDRNQFIISKILNYCHGFSNETILDGVLSWEFWIFEFHNNITHKYFYQIYKYFITYKLKKMSKGIGVPRIQYDLFINLKIPLPSLEIQKKIVEKLSKIEHNISTITQRISQLGEEKEFHKDFGRKKEIKDLLLDVEKVKLGDVCDKIENGKAVKKENRTGGSIPYYGANGHIKKSFMNTSLLDGKYLLCAQDGSIGAIHKVNGKFWPNNHVHILTIKSDVTYEYIYYILKYFVDYSSVTTGQIPKLNQNNLKNKIKIPLPSLEIQEQLNKIFEEKEIKLQSFTIKIEEEKKHIQYLQKLAREIINSYC